MKITSVRVETKGAHDHVSVFVDGKLSGVLVVDAGEGEGLRWLLPTCDACGGSGLSPYLNVVTGQRVACSFCKNSAR